MNVTPIESVLDIYDNRILWADLGPHFKGYQISNTGIIRSMKFYKRYPYGTLVSITNSTVRLSNSLNQIEQVSMNDLCNNKYIFNIPTYYTDPSSRNPIITSKSKIMTNKIKNRDLLKQPSGFHFKVID